MRKIYLTYRLINISILLLILFNTDLTACDVPVYRYALERWSTDTYELLLYHRGTLTAEQDHLFKTLDAASRQHGGLANYHLEKIDLNAMPPPHHLALWHQLAHPKLPILALVYPLPAGKMLIIHTDALTESSVRHLAQSPVRKELVARIESGQVGVWLFLASGDRSKDTAAAERLELALDSLNHDLLHLASQSVPPVSLPAGNVSLFSIARIEQADTTEKVLVQSLLRSESDLMAYSDYPMAFPVFGRGRVLYALVGDGINTSNIREACQHLIGPCSCEIKAENQGMDLLIAADWESMIAERVLTGQLAPEPAVLPERTPPVSRPPAILPEIDPLVILPGTPVSRIDSLSAPEMVRENPSSGKMLRTTMLLTAILLISIVTAASIIIIWRRKN
ncbi:hypothetical protein JXJ21_14190 [candidate division KSB1 bacterium]|nr:hypothetical protein [candidate division KSB1 bacterium]